MKILIVEDEQRLCSNIERHLRRNGYATEACYTGNDALELLQTYEYDAVILDIMLPGVDGLTILRWMRERRNGTPVILLTAMNTVEDRIRGLNQGADDYLPKPFALEELSARLRAVTRRQGAMRGSDELNVGTLTLDTRTRTARREGRTIELTAREYAILEYLMINKGMVITREQLLQHIWNNDYEIQSNVVDVYIRTLRRKVDEGFSAKLIYTLRGVGYSIREGDNPEETKQ